MTDTDARLERWLEALCSTPGLTSLRAVAEARRVHLDGSLAALERVSRLSGPIVDVGSGGGSPGIPLAASLPQRDVVLLEASERKCRFLEAVARDFPNVTVMRCRAEEHETDVFGVAVARALAPPPTAAEWCLPLVAAGGCVILYVGPTADVARVASMAPLVGGGPPVAEAGLIVIPKIAATPAGFPRRPGMARKRPLA